MPLGNLTSQFFANVYLNELDYYIKYGLGVKYYIRYVDDFVIFHNDEKYLHRTAYLINIFLNNALATELHPEKTSIRRIYQGIRLLGFRVFLYHRLLKKSNIRKFKIKIERICQQYDRHEIDYDKIYDFLEGWIAYALMANSHKLRIRLLTPIAEKFPIEISSKEYNR